MPLKPQSKNPFAQKAQPQKAFDPVLIVPYDDDCGILEVPASKIINIIYNYKKKQARQFDGHEPELMRIRLYFNDGHYSAFDMDPKKMRAMHRKLREGHDVDYRTFYDEFPEENPNAQADKSPTRHLGTTGILI